MMIQPALTQSMPRQIWEAKNSPERQVLSSLFKKQIIDLQQFPNASVAIISADVTNAWKIDCFDVFGALLATIPCSLKDLATRDLMALKAIKQKLVLKNPSATVLIKNDEEIITLLFEVENMIQLERFAAENYERVKTAIVNKKLPSQLLAIYYKFCNSNKYEKLSDIFTELTKSAERNYVHKHWDAHWFYQTVLINFLESDYCIDSLKSYLKIRIILNPNFLQANLVNPEILFSQLFSKKESTLQELREFFDWLTLLFQKHKTPHSNLKIGSHHLPSAYADWAKKDKKSFESFCQVFKNDIKLELDVSTFSRRDGAEIDEYLDVLLLIWPHFLYQGVVVGEFRIVRLLETKFPSSDMLFKIFDRFFEKLPPEKSKSCTKLAVSLICSYIDDPLLSERFNRYFHTDIDTFLSQVTLEPLSPSLYEHILKLFQSKSTAAKELREKHFPLATGATLHVELINGLLNTSRKAPGFEIKIFESVLQSIPVDSENSAIEKFLYCDSFILDKNRFFPILRKNEHELLFGAVFKSNSSIFSKIKRAAVDGQSANNDDLRALNNKYQTPLHVSLIEGKLSFAKQILDHYKRKRPDYLSFVDNLGYSAIMYAAVHGHKEIFSELLEKGYPLYFRRSLDFTGRFIAQKEILILFLEKANKEQIEEFVTKKFPEQPDCPSPCEEAIIFNLINGRYEIVEQLKNRFWNNRFLSQTSIEELSSKIATSAQLECAFKHFGTQLLPLYPKFVTDNAMKNADILATWCRHLKSSDKVRFYAHIIQKIKKMHSSPIDPKTVHLTQSGFCFLLDQAGYKYDPPAYFKAWAFIRTEGDESTAFTAAFLDKKLPLDEWEQVATSIKSVLMHVKSCCPSILNLSSVLYAPFYSAGSQKAKDFEKLLTSTKDAQLIQYSIRAYGQGSSPAEIKATWPIMTSLDSLLVQFIKANSLINKLSIVRYIHYSQDKAGIFVLQECIKSHSDPVLLKEALGAFANLGVTAPAKCISQIIQMCEIRNSDLELKTEAIKALCAMDKKPGNRDVKQFLQKEITLQLTGNSISKSYVVTLVRAFAFYEEMTEDEEFLQTLFVYIDSLIANRSDDPHVKELAIAMLTYSSDMVLAKVSELISHFDWQDDARLTVDSITQRIGISRFMKNPDLHQVSIDRLYANFLQQPNTYPELALTAKIAEEEFDKKAERGAIEKIALGTKGVIRKSHAYTFPTTIMALFLQPKISLLDTSYVERSKFQESSIVKGAYIALFIDEKYKDDTALLFQTSSLATVREKFKTAVFQKASLQELRHVQTYLRKLVNGKPYFSCCVFYEEANLQDLLSRYQILDKQHVKEATVRRAIGISLLSDATLTIAE